MENATLAISDNSEPLARNFVRCELLLATIELSEKAAMDKLVRKTGIPKRTIHALMTRLEEQHRVIIHRVNGRRYGYYKVVDWGNLNKLDIVRHIQTKYYPGAA